MCCFSARTEAHSTKIFARQTAPGTQALVYQMQYAAAQPTAMILPLPVALPAAESSVRWTSLKDDPSFFAQLDRGYPEPESFSLSRSKSASAAATATIAVHDVGDFIASFVPSQADFARVDPRFQIPKDVWAQIPEYSDYGFAVFQLKELAGAPHPIAFHFQSRLVDSLYFPTVHIHDGTVHATDVFDHALYLQEPRFDGVVAAYQGPTAPNEITGFVRSKDKVASFADVGSSLGLLAGEFLVHRRTVVGMLPNKDTIVKTAVADAGMRSGCGRCDVASRAAPSSIGGGAGLALAGLAWIIRRRHDRRS